MSVNLSFSCIACLKFSFTVLTNLIGRGRYKDRTFSLRVLRAPVINLTSFSHSRKFTVKRYLLDVVKRFSWRQQKHYLLAVVKRVSGGSKGELLEKIGTLLFSRSLRFVSTDALLLGDEGEEVDNSPVSGRPEDR